MTPADRATIIAAVEAMSEATRRYRRGTHLPGRSTDVPGWVKGLDASQIHLAAMLDREAAP